MTTYQALPDDAHQAKTFQYLPQNTEIITFEACVKNQLPVLLKGPTGCGKTRFVEHMATKLKRPLYTVACHDDLSATDLIGRHLINHQGTVWQDGPLTRAVRDGGICYLDEITEARKDTTIVIHPLADHRRILPIDRTGELLKAHPDFVLVASYNPDYQSIIKNLKPSTRQRFASITLKYPNKETEINIIHIETGLDKDKAEVLVNIANNLRNLAHHDLEEGASTRLLIYAAKLLLSGLTLEQISRSIFAEPLSDNPETIKNILTIISAHSV